MRLIALMPVRNEDWVIGLTSRAVLQWVDHLVVLEHANRDATADILREVAQEYPDRVTVLNEPGETWTEMAHRQRLLEEGRRQGGTHFALIDADELLAGGSTCDFIRGCTDQLAPGKFCLVPLRAMWRTLLQYRQDASVWSRARATVTFADHPSLCWQTAGGYDYHHREPYGSTLGRYSLIGGLDFEVNAIWLCTMVKEHGKWLVASFQFAPSIFDNPIANKLQRTVYWAGGIAAVIGIALGALLGRMSRRKKI